MSLKLEWFKPVRQFGIPNRQPGVSVVVPCYNSQTSLPQLVDRLHAECSKSFSKYEILLIDDGSQDGTWQTIEDRCAKTSTLRGIKLRGNFGQHNATLCGITYARLDIVVTIDDDLQYDPADIARLVQTLESGCDLVYGVTSGINHSLWRAAAAYIIRSTMRALDAKDYSKVTSFRCFRREIAAGLDEARGDTVCIDSLLAWTGAKVGFVPVQVKSRGTGTSGYTLNKLINVGIDLILSDGSVGFRFFSYAGAFACTLGVLGLLLGSAFNDSALIVYLASAVSFLFALQFVGIGIILKYLQKLSYTAMRRPLFVVQTELSIAQTTKDSQTSSFAPGDEQTNALQKQMQLQT